LAILFEIPATLFSRSPAQITVSPVNSF